MSELSQAGFVQDEVGVTENNGSLTLSAPIFDPSLLTANRVIEQMEGRTEDEINAVIELEEAGKKRKTLVSRLKDLLKRVESA